MQSGFPAGELEDFNGTFAIDNTLNSALQIGQGNRVHFATGAERGIGVASWTGEIARIDDLDQGQASGKLFKRAIATPAGVPAQRASGGTLCRATSLRVPTAAA